MTLIAVLIRKSVVAVDVAGRACSRRVHSRQRKPRSRMSKSRRTPRRCRVTCRALMTELTRNMVRVRGPRICRCVTIPTGLRKSLILITRVALVARNSLMSPNQLKCGGRVTECRGLPDRRGMTRCAVMCKVARNVVRIGRLLELAHMTLIAIREF